ncbi:MAG: decaprenyl-phosphate phosphoribosyltransferase [bacterium]
MSKYIRLIRPTNWIKNLLVFGALLFAGRWFDLIALYSSLLTFTAFCALASSLYVINDWIDRERDRQHPAKSDRPLASGEIGGSQAILLGFVLLFICVVCLSLLPTTVRLNTLFVLAIYASIMLAYNAGVKHQPGLDVIIVAGGFLLRALAGGVAINVPVTSWFVISVFFLSLTVVSGKRRSELVILGDQGSARHRPVMEYYSEPLMDVLIAISAGSALVTYSLWTVTSRTAQQHSPSWMPISILFVVYGLFRFLYHVYVTGEAKKPERIFYKDPYMALNILAWAGVVAFLLTI